MLESLFVKDFAIVGEAEIGFDAGLTVVTGETGAGKSLLVDALLLLAGGRGDASMVRHGSERAELSASFGIGERSDILNWLRSEELDDEDACELRRVIRSEGQSRAWINGRPVTLTQLRALGEQLIEIHGQHDQQALLDRNLQRNLLDAFGNHGDSLAALRDTVREWQRIGADIRTLSAGHDHAERLEWLAHQRTELDAVALTPKALEELESEHRRLGNAGQLVQGAAGLAELLDGDSEFSLGRLLARAQSEASRLAELDPLLAEMASGIDAARIELDEAGTRLLRYQDSLELDPQRLADIDSQFGVLHELARKHRVPVAGLKAHAAELGVEHDTLLNAGERLGQLQAALGQLSKRYAEQASTLGKARATTAVRMSKSVSGLMDELGMPGGRFEIELETIDSATPDANGAERCEFLVSANPGQPPRPLRKVASGGELSRISLAIEVAALGLDSIGTMVFDEVDTGIGGAVAEVVGQKLRRLGSQRQVLCVTHLPQVASQGHSQLRVSKANGRPHIATIVEKLGAEERVAEIARMLAGLDVSEESLAHARQMLSHGQATP
ncbi:MAG: DNA repair protein RecN [Dokdonella sp.]